MAASRKTLLENFQAGDLIYGLEDKRRPVREALERRFADVPITIDQLNNVILGQKNIPDNAKFSDEIIKNYHSAIGNYKKQIEKGFTEKAISQACKASLLHYNVHFILDGLTLASAFDKTAAHYQSYTSKEIRCAIKNLDKIADKVKFYHVEHEYDLSGSPMRPKKTHESYKEVPIIQHLASVDKPGGPIEKWMEQKKQKNKLSDTTYNLFKQAKAKRTYHQHSEPQSEKENVSLNKRSVSTPRKRKR